MFRIQKILDLSDYKTNILDVPVVKNIEEKFSSLVNSNDHILEKLSVAMDLVENPDHKITLNKTSKHDLIVAVQNGNECSTFKPMDLNEVVLNYLHFVLVRKIQENNPCFGCFHQSK